MDISSDAHNLSGSSSRTALPHTSGTTPVVKPDTIQGALGDVGRHHVSAYGVLFAETVPIASSMDL
ncbi:MULTISPECIES: hypothetical protein [unclassified Prochlorococcus]|uniref:hypothetical protein n=1 Tax=unclassified Prochlorococcus TaxID=2627481 RepID=UPI0039A7233E